MEEAEQVAGSTGKEKRAYAVEAVRAIAAHSLSVDDASFVASLAPYLVDLVVGTSKGLLRVNVNEKGEPSPRCCILS
jgi:hypothetical protein